MRPRCHGKIRLSLCASIVGAIGIAGLGVAAFAPALNQDHQRKSTEPPTASQGKFCSELFIAVGMGNAKGVDDLLAHGADPNARNGLGFTPLYMAAATHQSNMVDALLKAGAKFDAPSTYGTPLTFACISGNVPDAMRFLSMGAKADFMRTDGMTPLAMATNADCQPIVQELIKRKVDVNNQDDGGDTALITASRNGFTDVGKTLIDGGAKVDLADVDGITPLMAAAMNGHTDTVKMLLANGAKPNTADPQGRTALILAANYGDFPDVVQALINGKANANSKDAKGRTALQLAAGHGYAKSAQLLAGGKSIKVASMPSRSPKQAVTLSLKMIQSSTRAFDEGATCVSCHQEGLGRMTTGDAMLRGFRLDMGLQKAQALRINGMVNAMKPLHEAALKDPHAMLQLPLIEINEVSTMYSWILSGMAAQKQPATPALNAMAMCLARQQAPNGAWTFALPRVPMQSSFFTFTAYSVNALNAYAPKSASKEVAERIGNARKWLVATPAQDSEDRASKLLALKWASAPSKDIKDAAAAIAKDQRADGGWSQLPNMPSDAYATGEALYALRVGGGMSVKDPIYRKGEKFLLLTQDDDGTWFTNKRAIPANNYFDSGFPHGESQYASFNATCWATLALLPSAK